MRRLLLPTTLVLALAACSPVVTGPRETLALEQMVSGVGLDVAAARRAVVDFLQAYADAADDHGAALTGLVGAPELRRWIRWLDVQNTSFPGEISGEVHIGALTFQGAVSTRGTLAAQIDVSATVTFEYVPAEGEAFPPIVRRLDGPVTLARRGTGEWVVIDATRDGQSIADSIQPLSDQVQSDRGITVRIDSLFTFPPYWSFNLVVENHSLRTVTLDPKRATISSVQAGVAEVSNGRGATPSLTRIPAGTRVEGSINFATQPDAPERVLTLAFGMGRRLLEFRFALDGLVNPRPVPIPTASGPP